MEMEQVPQQSRGTYLQVTPDLLTEDLQKRTDKEPHEEAQKTCGD